MSFSVVYLVQRFFYRIYEFIRHWYGDGFLWFVRHTINFLESLDRFFALRVTLRYWFKPLYQDYTAIGYILGFFFRSGRLIFGGLIYLAVAIAALALYLIWALVPAYILYKGFYGQR